MLEQVNTPNEMPSHIIPWKLALKHLYSVYLFIYIPSIHVAGGVKVTATETTSHREAIEGIYWWDGTDSDHQEKTTGQNGGEE